MCKKWVTWKKKILNRAKDYYENDKERLKVHAREKYRNLSEEEKNKKREYGKTRYHNKNRYQNIKKIIARQEGLNITMNKISF